ncbi:hypothetical protein O3M35_007349 [Rhynocoris fuscipes]|uniref:Enoyl reductase (ER) domain-containing protein n=1 Tax=Rhynocoris fuscipes TaxID=488301 RepID=A0AAW1DBU6_9HEMI
MFKRTIKAFNMFIRRKGYKMEAGEINLSVVVHRSNDVTLEVRPIPTPRENELLIRVGYVCLSDLDLQYVTLGPSLTKQGYAVPYVLGNQATGIVLRAGVGVQDNFQEGDRVVIEPGVACHKCEYCQQGRFNLCPHYSYMGTADRPGALCRFITHPMKNCFKLPQHIGLDDGSLCTRLASAIHACKRAGLDKNSVVAIIGSGFSGITLVMTCKLLGLKNIFVVEFSEYRLGLARHYGAEYVLKFKPNGDPHYLKEIIEEIVGRLPDVTFDTGETGDSLDVATTITRSAGQVIIVGPRPHRIMTSLHHVTFREIDIRGVFNAGQCFQEATQYIKAGLIRVKDLRPTIVPLEHALEAFNNARVNIGGNSVVLVECFKEDKQ